MNITIFLQIIGTLFGLIFLMFGVAEDGLLVGAVGIILLALVIASVV